MELSKPAKKAFELNDECLNPQAIEKTKVGLSARVSGESARNALTYYVKNGHPEWSGTLNFLNVIGKWWNLLNIKSVSKGKRKRDINMEPIDASNIARFSAFMNMSSGKSVFSKQTFLSCIQTSRSFPLLVQHLLESDPLEKRFGRFRQLSGANYIWSVKQFLDVNKSIRMRSLIKFSGYIIK